MDWSLFHTVNRWSTDSPWAHGFFRSYANYGIVLFGLGLAAAGWIGIRGDARPRWVQSRSWEPPP